MLNPYINAFDVTGVTLFTRDTRESHQSVTPERTQNMSGCLWWSTIRMVELELWWSWSFGGVGVDPTDCKYVIVELHSAIGGMVSYGGGSGG